MAVADNNYSTAVAVGENFMQHYGVKGMKWGVNRETAKAAGGAIKKVYGPSPDAVKAGKAQLKAKVGGVRTMTNAEMRIVINRMALEKQYRDLYGEHQLHDAAVSQAKRWTKKGARWTGHLLEDIIKDAGASWLKRPGSNVSGRTSARAHGSNAAWSRGQQFAGELGSNRLAIGR